MARAGRPGIWWLVVALALIPSQAAASERRQTDVFPGREANISLGLLDGSDSCLTTMAALELGHAGDALGYNVEFLVFDECTGDVLLQTQTPESELPAGAVTIAPDLSTATIDFAGPVDAFEGVSGAFAIDLVVTFDVSAEGGSFDSTICVPLEEDPETFEPLPGTDFMAYRQHNAFGWRYGVPTSVEGSVTVTLVDGRTFGFVTTDAQLLGQISTGSFVQLEQTSGPTQRCRPRTDPDG